MAWGKALRDWRLAGSLAVRSALPAALAYFLVYLLMDLIGYRVEAPGAEARATMITVTFVACLGAVFGGEAALGSGLRRYSLER